MLGGEEPAQELMLSGQVLQQLTVLRGRNGGSSSSPSSSSKSQTMTSWVDMFWPGIKPRSRACTGSMRSSTLPIWASSVKPRSRNKPSKSEVPEPAALLTLSHTKNSPPHVQVGGHRGRRDSLAADAEVDVLADPHGVTGTCTPRPYPAKASRRTHSSRHTRSTPTARETLGATTTHPVKSSRSCKQLAC